MIKKKNFSLKVLEEYAGILSHAQATRLYEAKTKRKYNKALFEAESYKKVSEQYSFYLDIATIYDFFITGSDEFTSIDDVIQYLKEYCPTDLDVIKQHDDSLMLLTSRVTTYENLLDALDDIIDDHAIVTDGIDPKYIENN